MYDAEFESTGAFETSALHQLSDGNNGPGGDPGNPPPSTACPAAADATSITLTRADATAAVRMRAAGVSLIRRRSGGG